MLRFTRLLVALASLSLDPSQGSAAQQVAVQRAVTDAVRAAEEKAALERSELQRRVEQMIQDALAKQKAQLETERNTARREYTYWYAEDAKRFVKYTSRSSGYVPGMDADTDFELVAYQLDGSKPIGPAAETLVALGRLQ